MNNSEAISSIDSKTRRTLTLPERRPHNESSDVKSKNDENMKAPLQIGKEEAQEARFDPGREVKGTEETKKRGEAALGYFTSAWSGTIKKDADRKGGFAETESRAEESGSAEEEKPRASGGKAAPAASKGRQGKPGQAESGVSRQAEFGAPGQAGSGAIQGDEIKQYQEKLKRELGPLVSIQNPNDIDKIEGKIPTLSELGEVFKTLRDDPKIPWENINEGCYARAHVAAEKLMEKGFNTSKIFAKVDEKDLDDLSKRLRANNKFDKGEWWFHTAPLVFAKDEKTGKVDGYVLDPSLNREKPVKATEWLKSSWNGKFPVSLDITHPDQYQPPEKVTPSVPREFSMEKFRENMEHARGTNSDYADVLEWIKEKYYAKHSR